MRSTSGKRFNQRVEIWTRATTISDFGEHSESFNVTAKRWAFVEPLNGREYFANVGENSEVTTRFLFRYDSVLSVLNTSDRLKFSGEHYDIKSIINVDNMNREVVIMAVRNERQR